MEAGVACRRWSAPHPCVRPRASSSTSAADPFAAIGRRAPCDEYQATRKIAPATSSSPAIPAAMTMVSGLGFDFPSLPTRAALRAGRRSLAHIDLDLDPLVRPRLGRTGADSAGMSRRVWAEHRGGLAVGGRTGLAGGRNVAAFEGVGTRRLRPVLPSERSGAVTASSTERWERSGNGAMTPAATEENEGPAFRGSFSNSTAGSLTGLGRSSVVDSTGTVVISPHLGHFTRRPACFASTLNRPPHCEQRQICSMVAIISFPGGDARNSLSSFR